MAERQVEKQDPQELNQLENQLQDIQADISRILMAPRQEKEIKKAPATANEDDLAEDELREIANVADNLDSLNSVLDTIEERADQIRAQLLELLTSNREIRQSIREENENNQGHCQQQLSTSDQNSNAGQEEASGNSKLSSPHDE